MNTFTISSLDVSLMVITNDFLYNVYVDVMICPSIVILDWTALFKESCWFYI